MRFQLSIPSNTRSGGSFVYTHCPGASIRLISVQESKEITEKEKFTDIHLHLQTPRSKYYVIHKANT